jgi:hypothetical protein
MDETYFCPDCHAEHTEPQDAVLGHVARCLTCAVAVDIQAARTQREDDVPEIRVAA